MADNEAIGLCVGAGGVAKVVAVSSAFSGIARSGLAKGVGAAPTFPLEASVVCMKGD